MGKPKKIARFREYMRTIMMAMKENKSTTIVYFVLRFAVIAVMILQILNGNYENVFLCILTLILFIVPSFIELKFKVYLPSTLEIIILLFIFAAEILGEIHDYYYTYQYWDTILHTINGFLAAAVGYSLVDLLNKSDRVKFELSPIFMAIVAFSFSMTIGELWEFFEFGMDQLFGMNTQKDTILTSVPYLPTGPNGERETTENITSVIVNGIPLTVEGYVDIGLIDTMYDLIVNFVGAFIFSVFGFFYAKGYITGKFIKRFIPRKRPEEMDYLNGGTLDEE